MGLICGDWVLYWYRTSLVYFVSKLEPVRRSNLEKNLLQYFCKLYAVKCKIRTHSFPHWQRSLSRAELKYKFCITRLQLICHLKQSRKRKLSKLKEVGSGNRSENFEIAFVDLANSHQLLNKLLTSRGGQDLHKISTEDLDFSL